MNPNTGPETTPAAAPFSIAALAQHMGIMRKRAYLTDVLARRLGDEKPMERLSARRLAQRHAGAAHNALLNHLDAIETLILWSRAETLEDAVAQVMVACGRLDWLTGDPKEAATYQAQVNNALQSALRVLARDAGVDLASIGGRHLASTWADPWPYVDIADVVDDEPLDGTDVCISVEAAP